MDNHIYKHTHACNSYEHTSWDWPYIEVFMSTSTRYLSLENSVIYSYSNSGKMWEPIWARAQAAGERVHRKGAKPVRNIYCQLIFISFSCINLMLTIQTSQKIRLHVCKQEIQILCAIKNVSFFCGTKTLLIIKEYHYRQETKQTQEKKKKDLTTTRPNCQMSKFMCYIILTPASFNDV